MKSWKKPTPERVNKAISLLGRAEQCRYFFAKLENPEWIEPLRENGFFKNPPPRIEDRTSETISFPIWPESRYLVRMASLKPEIVLDIILGIPDTNNTRVHEDVIDAALSMPANLAAKLADKAKEWVKSPYQLLLPDKLGKLVTHLVEGEQVGKGFDLAGALFEVVPITRMSEIDLSNPAAQKLFGKDQTVVKSTEPKSRFDLWVYYEDTIKKCIPILIQADGMRTLHFLCDLLEKAVEILQDNRDGANDFSNIWRPVIEDHEHNLGGDIENVLVSAVRDTAETIVKEKPDRMDGIVRHLKDRPWRVFQRLALYLLWRFPDAAPELTREWLVNREFFYDRSIHEYSMLLKSCFGQLSSEHQDEMLSWVEAGPPTLNQNEHAQHRRFWQKSRLSLIRDYLPEKWRRRYDELVDELEEPEQPSCSTPSRPIGTKPSDELQTITVDELVEFLKRWQPSDEAMKPTPEELARKVGEAVAASPTKFACEAPKFKGLDPTYVRAILGGFVNAVRDEKSLPWESVLELCEWVVQQPKEIPGRRVREFFADRDWGWTRKVIAHLLEIGFGEGDSEIPFEFKEKTWEILYPITRDSDPTPEYEQEHGGDNIDSFMSINTTRDLAMHTVIQYALWCRRHFENLSDGKQRVQRGFEEFPEVREALDFHLEPDNDPSLAIRSVYGRFFPWLVFLDREWAKTNIPRIFPADETLRNLRDAAWDAYITYCPAYEEVFDVLSEEYHRAVEEIGRSDTEGSFDLYKKLAEHLMVFYWRGKIELDDELLIGFWEKASDDLSGYTIQFIGLSLEQTDGEVPENILERLRELWGNRLKTVQDLEGPDNQLKQVTAFGWWFVSGKFNDTWALEQLKKALDLAKWVESHHLHGVIAKLSEIVSSPAMREPENRDIPKLVIECLSLLVRNEHRGWAVTTEKDNIRKILTFLLTKDEPELRESAESLVHELGARGYYDFRDLLR